MAVSAASLVHKNCPFWTRFNLLNPSSFIYRYTLRCSYFSAHSASTVFPLEKRLSRYACRKGVKADGQLIVSRCTSTDSTTLASRFQKLRKILYDFYLGGKRLFQDVKLTWKIRRKLRENSWDYNVLERKELWKMTKVRMGSPHDVRI